MYWIDSILPMEIIAKGANHCVRHRVRGNPRQLAYSIPSFFNLYRNARNVIPRADAARVLL